MGIIVCIIPSDLLFLDDNDNTLYPFLDIPARPKNPAVDVSLKPLRRFFGGYPHCKAVLPLVILPLSLPTALYDSSCTASNSLPQTSAPSPPSPAPAAPYSSPAPQTRSTAQPTRASASSPLPTGGISIRTPGNNPTPLPDQLQSSAPTSSPTRTRRSPERTSANSHTRPTSQPNKRAHRAAEAAPVGCGIRYRPNSSNPARPSSLPGEEESDQVRSTSTLKKVDDYIVIITSMKKEETIVKCLFEITSCGHLFEVSTYG